MMLDIIIKGGRIADGSGGAIKSGDVGIANRKIVSVGARITDTAKRVIDADGALVTPGFIDLHSHYDGQVTWDDKIDPSFSNGVTTAILGNCGVGFAPCRPGDQDRMIAVMEGVEAIPGIVLKEGVPFDWETFPEYMNFLDKRRYGLDVGVLLAHAPLRVYAMGQRAVVHERATEADLKVMTDALRGAIDAGAFGFSTGRIEEHIYGEDFARVPGTYAEHEEITALARVVGATGRGHIQIVPRGTAGGGMNEFIGRDARIAEHRLFEMLARESGRPVHYLLPQFDDDPDDWRAMLDETAKVNKAGLSISAHIAARGFGMLSSLDGYHNFMLRPAYREIEHLPRAERAAAMRDPSRRAAIMADTDLAPGGDVERMTWGMVQMLNMRAPIGFVMDGVNQDEPDASENIGALAARGGKEPLDFIYDHITEGDGDGVVVQRLLNYSNGNLDHVYEMLSDPNTLSSLGDGGAHVKLIVDSSMLPFHLTFWTRDRIRGPVYSVEKMVERITGRNAKAFGLTDRGVLAPGMRADVNIIDMDGLGLSLPNIKHDFPANGARYDQVSQGFIATLLNGVVTRQNDADTGERPGRLLRANAIG